MVLVSLSALAMLPVSVQVASFPWLVVLVLLVVRFSSAVVLALLELVEL